MGDHDRLVDFSFLCCRWIKIMDDNTKEIFMAFGHLNIAILAYKMAELMPVNSPDKERYMKKLQEHVDELEAMKEQYPEEYTLYKMMKKQGKIPLDK